MYLIASFGVGGMMMISHRNEQKKKNVIVWVNIFREKTEIKI